MPKPVVFIPGFPASELRDAATNEVVFPPSPGTLLSGSRKRKFFELMLDVPGRLVAGPPIRSVLNLAKQAQSLYDLLEHFGYTIAREGPSVDFAPVGWDWRLGVDAEPTMNAVATAIAGFAPQKVVVVLHSTGGLVFRAFLARHPELVDSIDEVLAFGAAWCGTLEALYAVHEGRAQTILGIPLMTADESANLIGHAQAAYDLFPPDPARTDLDDVKLVHGLDGHLKGANVDLSWIKANRRDYAVPRAQSANERLGARPRDFELPLTNVVGWGAATHPGAVLEEQDIHFLPDEKDAGDGTVPRLSASWIRGPHVRTLLVPIGAFVADPIADRHAHMWDSLAVTDIFRELFRPGTPRNPFVAAAADSDDAIDLNSGSVTIRLTAQSNDGQPLPNCIATARIIKKKIPIPFQGRTSAIFRLNRQGIESNFGHLFRFEIDFTWDGGSRKNVAVAFRAP
ncbi:MAG: lipase/acyltransferase domain-containing protein [Thermoanaerobaculia bacterium]